VVSNSPLWTFGVHVLILDATTKIWTCLAGPKLTYIINNVIGGTNHNIREMYLILVGAKCVRCLSGIVDGLRGKRKWPLLMALFFFLSSDPVTFLPEGVVLGS
jgi:hypothetical protein